MKIRNFTIFIAALPYLLNAGNYNIKDFGAVSDTSRLSTESIQNAIDECSSSGGGNVIIPAGSYKTGSIILKNNVLLYLENGATLYGSTDLKDYKNIKPAYKSLRTHEATIQLIYAENIVNAGISGYGTIDGQGKSFRKLNEIDEGITRPHLLRFVTCKNITIENVRLLNSGCWMQHYLACDNLKIHGLNIFNHNNYNNDAIDIDGCRNVTLSDITADSDDDGITLKSTSPRPCENIAITNCIISSRCNAIKLGTESNGGFRNVCISNCIVKPSEYTSKGYYGIEKGLAGIALEIVDGGILEGISISNINIEGTTAPIFIRLGNRARPYQKDIPVDSIGKISNISISNVMASGAGITGCSITGLQGHCVKNVSLNNINIEFEGGCKDVEPEKAVEEKPARYPESTMFGTLPSYGFYIRHASGIKFNDIRLTVKTEDSRPALILDDVSKSFFNNVMPEPAKFNKTQMLIKDSHFITITDRSGNHRLVKQTGKNYRIKINKPGYM